MVEKRGGPPGTRGPGRTFHTVMQSFTHDPGLKMRALAAQLRAHAAETTVEHFRSQFERVASELEEAAADAESRIRFREGLKLVS